MKYVYIFLGILIGAFAAMYAYRTYNDHIDWKFQTYEKFIMDNGTTVWLGDDGGCYIQESEPVITEGHFLEHYKRCVSAVSE